MFTGCAQLGSSCEVVGCRVIPTVNTIICHPEDEDTEDTMICTGWIEYISPKPKMALLVICFAAELYNFILYIYISFMGSAYSYSIVCYIPLETIVTFLL